MIKDELLIPKSVSVILLLAFFKRQGVIQNVIVIDVRFTKNGITIYILHQNSKDSQTNHISGRISFSINQFFLRPANGIFCLKGSTTHIDLSL